MMIRPFQESDLDTVMQIWMEGNCQAHSFIPGEYWRSNEASVRSQIAGAKVYVYEEDGQILGFVGAWEEDIAGIFVDQGHRSGGIGRSLLDFMKEKHGALTLEVYQRNTDAVRFYLREGFQIVAERVDESTGEAEYVMGWKREERSVTLYLALSLDGYIADPKGGVEWLTGQEDGEESMDSYQEFVKGIDTIMMGWNTYHQIVTELSPEQWVYEDFTTYVFTHRKRPSTDKIRFTDESPGNLIRAWKAGRGKGIWVCGGADLAQQLMAEDLIDEYHISVIPTVLGDGIRLWKTAPQEQRLSLVRTQNRNGIVELVYRRERIGSYGGE